MSGAQKKNKLYFKVEDFNEANDVQITEDVMSKPYRPTLRENCYNKKDSIFTLDDLEEFIQLDSSPIKKRKIDPNKIVIDRKNSQRKD